ncbi:hypothetical protein GPJ56_009410 [Histomonas meleagridis]|uniref:uncharacterized protein n=1 Tax=Histomonas meleagridis TaxID=135588 RepID=UPI00355AA15F|nr:hypothetical protein GPJ56_009410 [Histomonas meleagridis]KAH0797486.1 hypothetical protein GO595_009807 [Histomonas meleagridis]
MTNQNNVPENKNEDHSAHIQTLERLQIVLDENNAIRSKFNALLTQVAPFIDDFNSTDEHPSNEEDQPHEDRVLTQEEIEWYQKKLQETLSDYKTEIQEASYLNSQIAKKHVELNKLKISYRIDQDDKLTQHNNAFSKVIQNLRNNTSKIQESWINEKKRLSNANDFLKSLYDTSVSDTKEMEEQSQLNLKSIQELTSSIDSAKEAIQDIKERLNRIKPRVNEYEIINIKHQRSEERLVQLSDELETIKNKIQTESLAANVRSQIDNGNDQITALNGEIDEILNKISKGKEAIEKTKERINDYKNETKEVIEETKKLQKIEKQIIEEKEIIKKYLEKYRNEEDTAGGSNKLLTSKLNNGIGDGSDDYCASKIRKQMVFLKKDLEKMKKSQSNNKEEAFLDLHSPTIMPTRKRVPLIPGKRKSLI